MARLLLAERNPTLRLLLTTLAGKAGHQIDAVDDGRAVLQRLDGSDYHCLLIGAPLLLNGPRPRTLLQHFEEEAVNVAPRIIVLTARTLDRELVIRAARLRVCAIVSQPFDNSELLHTIDACARNERPPRRFIGFTDATLQHVLAGYPELADW